MKWSMEEYLSLRKDGKKIKLKSATGIPSLGLTTGSQSQTKHNATKSKARLQEYQILS